MAATVLAQLLQQDILLACCAVNVTEIYMGMRLGEEAKNREVSAEPRILRSNVGDCPARWRSLPPVAAEGQTLSYTDVTIAAVALPTSWYWWPITRSISPCPSCNSSVARTRLSLFEVHMRFAQLPDVISAARNGQPGGDVRLGGE